jgi:hypothetical protein
MQKQPEDANFDPSSALQFGRPKAQGHIKKNGYDSRDDTGQIFTIENSIYCLERHN